MAEVSAVVLDVFEAELLSLGVLAQMPALRTDGFFTPQVVAHHHFAAALLLARARRVQQLVVESPHVLGRQLARGDAGSLQERLRQAIAELGKLLEAGLKLISGKSVSDGLVEQLQTELPSRKGGSGAAVRA